jgi:hypothetical protein
MQPVYITDPEWYTTFPHLVAPLPDEWLPGLLLRCDEVNRWESGGSARCVLRTSNIHGTIQQLNLITPLPWVLERLAQMLAIPLDAIVETTHLVELARLSSADRLIVEERGSIYHPLYLCPECFILERLLRRTLILSHISTCLQHGLQLVRDCRCGAKLESFLMKAQPFTCHRCGCPWENLPRIEASSERMAFEEQFQSFYTFFFSKGTPRLISKTLELIGACAQERGKKSLPFDALTEETDHGPRYTSPDYRENYQKFVKRKSISLGKLVYALVDLGLSTDDILECAE